jgi:hypothetical protein
MEEADSHNTLEEEFGVVEGRKIFDEITKFIEEFDRDNHPTYRRAAENEIVEIIMWYIEFPRKLSIRGIRRGNLDEAGVNAYMSVLRKYYITYLFLEDSPQISALRKAFLDMVVKELVINRKNSSEICSRVQEFMQQQLVKKHLPDQAALSQALKEKSDALFLALKGTPHVEDRWGSATFADTSSTLRPPPPRPEEPSPDMLPPTHSADLDTILELILDADYEFKKGNLEDTAYLKRIFDKVNIESQKQGIVLQPAQFLAIIEEMIGNRKLAQDYQGAAAAGPAVGPAPKGGKRHSKRYSKRHSKKYSKRHSNKYSKRNSKKRSKRHFRH